MTFGLTNTSHFEAKADIVGKGLMGKQRVVLKHDAGIALMRRQRLNLLVANEDPSLRNGLQAGDHPEKGGLSTSGRPEQCQKFALLERQVQRMNSDMLAKALGNAFQLYGLRLQGVFVLVIIERSIRGPFLCW